MSGALWRKGQGCAWVDQDSAPLPVHWGIPSCILSDLFLPLILVPVLPVPVHQETGGDRGPGPCDGWIVHAQPTSSPPMHVSPVSIYQYTIQPPLTK
jgi:hypothetical protein